MRLLIVSDDVTPDGLTASLQEAGIALERPPAEPPRRDRDELAEIAASLRAFEGLLGGDGPDAVLLGSASNQALAAILVASKLSLPVARLAGAGGEPGASVINRRVIEQLADATLAAEAEAIAAWARDT
jgi:UDP-N-acetylglucosamine 2-epimerase